ncbi:hypothetical protein FOA52_010598 [Chlamydomonas sp. UWO 241]|nr:hypothetical protein FOA52_010598 [Chlamydomonas sp. UWO 241]
MSHLCAIAVSASTGLPAPLLALHCQLPARTQNLGPACLLRPLPLLKGYQAYAATAVIHKLQAGGFLTSGGSSGSGGGEGGENMGLRDGGGCTGDGVPLLLAQLESNVSKASTMHAVAAYLSLHAASLGAGELEKEAKWALTAASKAVALGRTGKDSIVDCVQYFTKELGYDVVMVTDDNNLMVRMEALAGSLLGGCGRLSTLTGAELESDLKGERLLWPSAASPVPTVTPEPTPPGPTLVHDRSGHGRGRGRGRGRGCGRGGH